MITVENRHIRRWRDRAEECRAVAATMRNEETRRSLLATAERCEKMADHAEMQARMAARVAEMKLGRKPDSGD
jgi:hypothetical protein